MNKVTLTFGTLGYVEFSVSAVQNKYDHSNLLKIAMEESGPDSYTIYIFGADNLDSVFPVFKTTEISYFKFQHNDKVSPCIRVPNNGKISSFPIEGKVYGLEILNKRKQMLFEQHGGHNQKELVVWFGIDEGEDVCDGRVDSLSYPPPLVSAIPELSFVEDCEEEVFLSERATIALNNTSTERFQSLSFREPFMNKRSFSFCFQKGNQEVGNNNMVGNLYIS